jgi:hypothetical protein
MLASGAQIQQDLGLYHDEAVIRHEKELKDKLAQQEGRRRAIQNGTYRRGVGTPP